MALLLVQLVVHIWWFWAAVTLDTTGQKLWLCVLPQHCVSGVFSLPVEQLDLLH